MRDMRGIKFLADAGQPDLFADRSTVGHEVTAVLLPVKNMVGGATNRGLRSRERQATQVGLRLSRLYSTPDARRPIK